MPFKNKEERNEYQRRYRLEHRQEKLGHDKKYREKHKLAIIESQRLFYQKHREEILERHRQYREGNRDKERQRHKRYYYTIRGYLQVIFRGARQRCSNPKRKDYKYYGGRGIRCLFKSSDEFVDYVVDILKVDPRGLQMDRIDNCGNYEQGNIRFVTAKVNANNKGQT